jgi:transcriptional regulator with GAF, ATPase, and Fis domain
MSTPNPRLVVIAGPLKDSVFALPSSEVSLGRDRGNVIAINDPAMSRQHCSVLCDTETFRIRDLDSRNGTLVNGVPIREHFLKHGDRIAVGDTVLVFLVHDEDDVTQVIDGVEFDDDTSLLHSTIRLRPEDVLYLQPERMLEQLPVTSRLARNLNTLLKVSRVVHSVRDLEDLRNQILGLVFEVAPAERGALLLGTGDGDCDSFIRSRLAGTERSVKVSRTIVRQVLQQGIAILANDVPHAENLAGVESLVISQVRSLLCVPLQVFGHIIGCIYLDSSQPAALFDEEHLQLVTAIAGIAAVALENVRHREWLEEENRRLNTEINLEHNMVGESTAMRNVYQFLTRVAPAEATVLICGESGTGKELAARALHLNSPRANKPFVAINCAALNENLLESELFGHERGAFTGALQQKKGKLEVAHGGVVFLDEIGELAPTLQAKLLRVLQEREFERVGGTRSIPVDIRLIAATNRDLEEAVQKREFRQDLFYRLNVVSLTMPSLRERKEDIPLLSRYFVEKHSKKCNRQSKPISEAARACMMSYDWPGNVRELENAIERAVVLGSAEAILPEDLPEIVMEQETPAGVLSAEYHTALKNLKKQLILKALEDARGNYTGAAHALGLHPNYLHRLIKNLELKAAAKATPNQRFGQGRA